MYMQLGKEIFNLIMPLAEDIDSRLTELIPQEILTLFQIDKDEEGRIIGWTQVEESYDAEESGEQDMSNLSGDIDISANSQAYGDSADLDEEGEDDLEDPSQIKERTGLNATIPQSALIGKNKSLEI